MVLNTPQLEYVYQMIMKRHFFARVVEFYKNKSDPVQAHRQGLVCQIRPEIRAGY